MVINCLRKPDDIPKDENHLGFDDAKEPDFCSYNGALESLF